MAKLAFGKVWILTGCFHSKMEQAIVESYKEKGLPYGKNRVFINYSGHRPAEPSSVAVAATWHTLTRLLIHVIDTSREMCPGGRLVHPWELDYFASLIQYYYRKYGPRMKEKSSEEDFTSEIEFPFANSFLTQVKFVNGYVSVKLKILLEVEFEIKLTTLFSPGRETNGWDLFSFNKF
jgi:hypothetical protein